MGFSKAHLYDKEDQITSLFARAFGHPARLKILRKLKRDGPSSVEEISLYHPLSKPTMSEHLKILRTAHLITYKEKYPSIIYSLDGKNVTKAEAYLKLFFKSI